MESLIIEEEETTKGPVRFMGKGGRRRIKGKYNDEELAAFLQQQEDEMAIYETPTPGETVLGPSGPY